VSVKVLRRRPKTDRCEKETSEKKKESGLEFAQNQRDKLAKKGEISDRKGDHLKQKEKRDRIKSVKVWKASKRAKEGTEKPCADGREWGKSFGCKIWTGQHKGGENTSK